jgi:glycosyltransferase involved in cell wall biosynthesis
LKVCELCAVDFTLKRFLLPLIDRMQAEGWEVTAVCSDGAFVPGMRAKGYRIETLPIARSANPLNAIRSLLALVRLFRQERFDVLHVHTPVAAMLGRVAAWLAGIPLVIYTAHGFYFHDEMPALKRRVYIAIEWFGGRLTHYLFTVSGEDAETAVRLGIMRADRVMAVGNGASTERFDPSKQDRAGARRELHIPENAPVIGIVGRLVREKGYVEFFLAAEMIGLQFSEVYFLVVGERLESDHNAGIDQEIAQVKRVLGPRVILAGMREDVPAMLAAMDVFCLPSYREGMPQSIIEAMMMGKPVIATNIRGAREEVVAGQTGLLVATRDPAALADAFRNLLSDPSLRESMGQAGRERALNLYDEQRIVDAQVAKIRAVANLKSIG